jgi:sigma-B regulation protein RsbU (phosphoserine phosphatase)
MGSPPKSRRKHQPSVVSQPRLSTQADRALIDPNAPAPSDASLDAALDAPEPAAPTAASDNFEGDYRPADPVAAAALEIVQPGVLPLVLSEPSQMDFLLRLADALNTTLDLNTLMQRVADMIRAVIDYRIFAILLFNDRTQDLRVRFQIGHTPEAERMRVPIGQGVVGRAAQLRHAVLIHDVRTEPNYIAAAEGVRSELAVPLIIKNKVIGVLDLESEKLAFFTLEHQRLLEIVASRMAIAIENARLYTRVARQAQTLTVLNDISRELTSILDLDTLLERIGILLKRVVDYQMFTIVLWDDASKQYEHRFSTRYGQVVHRDQSISVGRGVIGAAVQDKLPVLAPDVTTEQRYIAVNPETRSELAVPLLYKNRVIGVMDLEHTRPHYYNTEHQTTLVTLAAQVAISIENARLYQQSVDDEARLERDLAMARQVQQRLLPSKAPALPHAEIFAKFIPASSIGGDLYDFREYAPCDKTPTCPRLAISLGDVSGKAAPAALFAALVSGLMRSLAQQSLSPPDMLAQLNDALQERKLESQFVSMLYAVWNDADQTMRLANAGAAQPIFVTRDGQTSTVLASGFPLGLFPGATYDELTIYTHPGDCIVFISDGITDAQNPAGESFGNDRLHRTLSQADRSSAQSTVQAVLKDVSDFQGGTDRFDDETVVVLRVPTS